MTGDFKRSIRQSLKHLQLLSALSDQTRVEPRTGKRPSIEDASGGTDSSDISEGPHLIRGLLSDSPLVSYPVKRTRLFSIVKPKPTVQERPVRRVASQSMYTPLMEFLYKEQNNESNKRRVFMGEEDKVDEEIGKVVMEFTRGLFQ